MKKNAMRRNLQQSIKRSLGRYIAIVAIIALGAGIFVGLRTTKKDMIATGQRYMDEQNMFDLRLLSTYGWSREDVARISGLEGVEAAEGVISMDAIAGFSGTDDEAVFKVYSIPEDINRLYLHGGRMPKSPDECLADGFHATDDILGKKIVISENNDQDTLDSLKYHTYTVVGYVSTPLYMDMTRGTTSLGNGSVSALLFLPEDSFDVDYYSEIMITLPGESTIYTDRYHDFAEREAERLEPLLSVVAQDRYDTLRQEAEEAYSDGLKEYEEGLAEYEDGKATADRELSDAKAELQDAEKEIADSEKKLEDGIAEWEKGKAEIEKNQKTLNDSRIDLANAKADAFSELAKAAAELMKNYKQVSSALAQIDDGISQIDSGISQIDSGISQLESGLQQLETMIGVTETMLDLARSSLTRVERALEAAKQDGQDGELIKELEASVIEAKAEVEKYETQLLDMQAQYAELSAQLAELRKQREELAAQRAELEEARKPLADAKQQLDLGFMELQSSQTQAENEFAAAEAKLDAAALQLDAAQKELDKGWEELEDGLKQLEEGKKELAEGWEQYYEGEAEVTQELSDAETKLQEASLELEDARQTIDSMEKPDVFALGRTTNVGYMALDSNSDIVEGVSTVFPAFFLLIAALVCITTMTRMVEEERTQIGTLKALGYGNGAIIGKYLAYAGSAALVGCGLGVLLGSIIFPMILWDAYYIIIFLGDYLIYQIDWVLCLLVVGVYTAVTLLVTWYCAHRSLKEVPAELIRPKPPTSGKKIFLEKLPFWHHFSFLNKVMLRNIFRYRQRLLMMLIGIGGCTALLLTGFGLQDSITGLADDQFANVVLYDIDVRFEEDQSDSQQAFRDELSGKIEDVFFFHQSSMELIYDDLSHDITFISADDGFTSFMDFHKGKEPVEYPGMGEAMISIGLSKKWGIDVGDSITLRDPDLRELELRVSGVYDNNVYNYVITSPETVMDQWQEMPEKQMACIFAAEDADVHELGVTLSEMEGVMSVTVNEDTQESVGKMLEALDLVVVTVVVCAAILAVTVLYNLTNINITERIREIATIKVLGFNNKETAAYVFKENLLLSVMGSVLGLGGGVLLHKFVISQIKVDMVWISPRLDPMSYVWAIVITILSAVVVDFLLYFRLDKINMAEALKSVE